MLKAIISMYGTIDAGTQAHLVGSFKRRFPLLKSISINCFDAVGAAQQDGLLILHTMAHGILTVRYGEQTFFELENVVVRNVEIHQSSATGDKIAVMVVGR